MGRRLKERTRFVEDMEAWYEFQQKLDDGSWQLGVRCFYEVQKRLREQERQRAEKERAERADRENRNRIAQINRRKKQERYERYWKRHRARERERQLQRQYKEWGLSPGVWETETGETFTVDP